MDDQLKWLEPLARKLMAAFIANRMGIGLDYAYKTYAKNAAVGDLWLALAATAEESIAKQMEQRLFPPSDVVPGVQ